MRSIKKVVTLGVLICTLGLSAYAEDIVTSSNPESKWSGSVFGDVGGQEGIGPKNFSISEDPSGSINVRAANNKGKIASSTDGLIYYYQEIDPSEDFTMTALMEINDYSSNNQVAFGLMVRDEILLDEHDSDFGTDYVAAGAIRLADPVVKHTLTRIEGKQGRKGDYSYNPSAGDELRVNLEKNGNTYTTWVEDEEAVVTEMEFSGDTMYIGVFAVRNADVTFNEVEIETE